MRRSSLATRLFLSATAWVVVILVITGFILSSVYRDATERAFDRRLNLYLRTLIAEVATPDEPPGPPVPVARRAAVRTAAVRLVLADHPHRYRKGRNARLALAMGQEAAEARGARRRADRGRHPPRLCRWARRPDAADGRAAGRSRRRRQIPGQRRRRRHARFSTKPAASIITSAARSSALAIVLLLTTIFQVRFGLAPLKRISDAIADIRSGRAERLEGEFPVEIAPLARETNALIDANREIVERARTHVGNLAHAIKTPLVRDRQRGLRPCRRSVCRPRFWSRRT